MKIIQEFLKLVLCGFILLTIILTLALAEAQEVTIYDRDWRVEVVKNHEMSRQGAKTAKVEQIPCKGF